MPRINRRSLKKPRTSLGFLLRSVAVVIVDDPAENVATTHRPMGSAIYVGDGNLLITALMGARGVEELNLFTHDPSKMGLIDDQQLVQAFFPH